MSHCERRGGQAEHERETEGWRKWGSALAQELRPRVRRASVGGGIGGREREEKGAETGGAASGSEEEKEVGCPPGNSMVKEPDG